MPQDRNVQLLRILRIIQLLQAHRPGFTIKELQERLEQSGFQAADRTIYRDIQAIEAAHLPIQKEGPTYRFHEELARNNTLQLDYPELLALYVVKKNIEPLEQNPLKFSLDSMFQKIETALGKGAVYLDKELDPFLDFQLFPKWGFHSSSEVLDTLKAACSEGHMLEIEYKSPSSEPDWSYQTYKVGPEYILFTHDGAYVYGKKMESNEFKLYALPRIRSAKMLDEPYDAELKPEERIHRDSFGVMVSGEIDDVEIELAEPMASYVAERKWHASQQVVRTEKGIRFCMRVRINDELARWVLGLGRSARVVKPDSLRTAVLENAQAISTN